MDKQTEQEMIADNLSIANNDKKTDQLKDVMSKVKGNLEMDNSLSNEQRENILSDIKDNAQKLMDNKIEPTEKMMQVMQEQQVKKEHERTQDRSLDIGR